MAQELLQEAGHGGAGGVGVFEQAEGFVGGVEEGHDEGDAHGGQAAGGQAAFEGSLAWRWKDRIDRRFMAQYADLPEMPAAAGPAVAAGLAGPEDLRAISTAAMRSFQRHAKLPSNDQGPRPPIA